MEVTVIKIKGAKMLPFRIVDEKGIEWARAMSLPLAEKIVPLVEESKRHSAEILEKLVLG